MNNSISNINSSKLRKNFTSKKSMSSQTEDVLISLMKEMGLKSKLQTDILQCLNIGQSLPFIPKEFIKYKNKALESNMKSKMLKLPARPIQRTKTQIELSGSYDIEKYRPNPSQTRPPREKERLQNIMAFGQDFEEKDKTVSKNVVVNPLEPIDLFDEILIEIKERKEFLDEMFQLGLGKKYLPEIQCQIALRLKELEKLDKSRAERVMSEYDL